MSQIPTPSPAALSPRHERFCQAYLADPNAGRAALAAGYAPRNARQFGARLLNRADVSARIAQLQAGLAERACARAEALMAKLETVFQRALDAHQFTAAARAVEAQARLTGALAAKGNTGGN